MANMAATDYPSSFTEKLVSDEHQSAPNPGLAQSGEKPKSPESVVSSESDDAPSVDDAIASISDVDSDSGVSGVSVISSTASLRSSIYEHVEEYGRTYHGYKEGKYLLPNDEQEQSRLEIQHALFGITLHGKLYLAPIAGSPQHVLDIGTGTGVWAIEFAVQHPTSNVLGTDLSAIQPLFVPPNCHFEVGDAEDEWVFPNKFDFIHGRALLSCFQNPEAVIRKAFDALGPGGYLEMQDGFFPMKYIGEPPVNSDLYKWNELVVECVVKSGRLWNNTLHYAKWMREAGFEDVVEKNFYWPTSTWAKGEYYKKVATYFQEDMLNGVEGISMKIFIRFMGWTAEEVKAFLVGVKRDFRDRSIHAYLPIKVVYGRKPLPTS